MKITDIARPPRFSILNLFENRQQYNQMLQPLITLGIANQDYLNDVINLYRRTLKRNDRIVWALKWYRITYLHFELDRNYDNEPEKYQKMAATYKKWTAIDAENRGTLEAECTDFRQRFHSEIVLEHIRSLMENIPEIDNMVWDTRTPPIDMMNNITHIEREWKSEQTRLVTPEPDDKIILSYDNGKYGWVLLDREYCRTEGDAMGHCGNTASAKSGDRILSFRTLYPANHKPHLTFIIDSDGYLGEMKGYANKKPAEKYHPYIIDLLKQDFIEGIKGGGYAPDQNFSISDLPDDISTELLNLKPELGTIIDKWRKNNRTYTPAFGAEFERMIEDSDLYYYDFDRQTGIITVDTFDTLQEIMKFVDENDYGGYSLLQNRLMEYQIFGGPKKISEDIPRQPTKEDIINTYSSLPPKTKKLINDYAASQNLPDDIYSVILGKDSVLASIFKKAIRHGYYHGTKNKLKQTMKMWLEDNNFEPFTDEDRETMRHTNSDTKYKYAITADYVMSILEEHEGYGEDIDNYYIRDNLLYFSDYNYNDTLLEFDVDIAANKLETEIKDMPLFFGLSEGRYR